MYLSYSQTIIIIISHCSATNRATTLSHDNKMADDLEEAATPPKSAPATLEVAATHRNSTSNSKGKKDSQESGFISYWTGPLEAPPTDEDMV